jgi:hypothetical protein
VKQWDKDSGIEVTPPSTIGDSVQLSEIRTYLSAMDTNRVGFIAQHATDPRVVQAVLGAPPFLSGLTDAEVGIVKAQVQKRVAPELAAAKAETLAALAQAEGGWRNAIAQINERGGLKKTHNGAAREVRAKMNSLPSRSWPQRCVGRSDRPGGFSGGARWPESNPPAPGQPGRCAAMLHTAHYHTKATGNARRPVRPCIHKSRLVSSGWSMSALPPEAGIRQRIEHVCFVPIAVVPTSARLIARSRL